MYLFLFVLIGTFQWVTAEKTIKILSPFSSPLPAWQNGTRSGGWEDLYSTDFWFSQPKHAFPSRTRIGRSAPEGCRRRNGLDGPCADLGIRSARRSPRHFVHKPLPTEPCRPSLPRDVATHKAAPRRHSCPFAQAWQRRRAGEAGKSQLKTVLRFLLLDWTGYGRRMASIRTQAEARSSIAALRRLPGSSSRPRCRSGRQGACSRSFDCLARS
jgi:hypothetical protein